MAVGADRLLTKTISASTSKLSVTVEKVSVKVLNKHCVDTVEVNLFNPPLKA